MATRGPIVSNQRRRRTGPTGPFSVDWNHPLTVGLEILWLPALSTIPQVGPPGGTVTEVTEGTTGRGTRYGPGSPRRLYYTIPTTTRLGGGTPFPLSLMWAGRAGASPSAGSNAFGLEPNSSDASPYDTAVVTNGIQAVNFFESSSSFNRNLTTSVTTGSHVIVGSIGSTSQSIYVNGLRATATTYTPATATQSAPSIVFGTYAGLTTRNAQTTNVVGAIWNRALTAHEAAELSADPFCFLRY